MKTMRYIELCSTLLLHSDRNNRVYDCILSGPHSSFFTGQVSKKIANYNSANISDDAIYCQVETERQGQQDNYLTESSPICKNPELRYQTLALFKCGVFLSKNGASKAVYSLLLTVLLQ